MRILDVDIEELKKIILSSKSKREVVQKITGKANSGTQMTRLSELIDIHRIDISHFASVFEFDFQRICLLVKESVSIKEVGEKLGKSIPGISMNREWYKKIKSYIDAKNIDVSHFDSQLGKNKGFNVRYSDDEAFKNPSFVSRQTIKERYLKKRVKPIECDECGIRDWRNKPIQLALDHIDGNSVNNTLCNLRLLCPNCHSQTETFAGKNLKVFGAEQRATERANLLKEKRRKFEEDRESEIQNFKNKILSSGIDFSKFGRNQHVAKILNISSQKAGLWLKKHMPEQYSLLKHKGIKPLSLDPN